eukprot:384733-Amphidinium_carterae.1
MDASSYDSVHEEDFMWQDECSQPHKTDSPMRDIDPEPCPLRNVVYSIDNIRLRKGNVLTRYNV